MDMWRNLPGVYGRWDRRGNEAAVGVTRSEEGRAQASSKASSPAMKTRTIGASSLNPLPRKFRSVPERDLWLGISRRVAGADARRSRWEGD